MCQQFSGRQLGMVMHVCNPSYSGAEEGQPQRFGEILHQNKILKGLEIELSGKTLTWHMQGGPGLNSQYRLKN